MGGSGKTVRGSAATVAPCERAGTSVYINDYGQSGVMPFQREALRRSGEAIPRDARNQAQNAGPRAPLDAGYDGQPGGYAPLRGQVSGIGKIVSRGGSNDGPNAGR